MKWNPEIDVKKALRVSLLVTPFFWLAALYIYSRVYDVPSLNNVMLSIVWVVVGWMIFFKTVDIQIWNMPLWWRRWALPFIILIGTVGIFYLPFKSDQYNFRPHWMYLAVIALIVFYIDKYRTSKELLHIALLYTGVVALLFMIISWVWSLLYFE